MWACAGVIILAGLWAMVTCRVQHCEKLDAEGQNTGTGVIRLIYSMERKCVLCYKEVNKLLALKSRMAKFGHNMEVSVEMNKPPTSNHRRKLPPELRVDITQIWRKLGKKNGHIFIFDKCGRLAYQVITPWSKQIYPFTGMAALSAIHDDPCGECNVTLQANVDPLSENAIHPINEASPSEKTPEVEKDYEGRRLGDSKIPLTIIYRSRHNHILDGRTINYKVVELRLNDPKYHGHAETSDAQQFNISIAKTSSESSTENVNELVVTESPIQETRTVPSSEYYDDYSDDKDSSSLENTNDQQETQGLMKHYHPLMKWMTCAQQIMGT